MSPLAYDTVSVPSATSLQLVAALTDTSLDTIRSLNPELRRDSTPPSEPYLLRVPPKRGHQMVALLKRIPADRRNQMARVVQAAPGDEVVLVSPGVPGALVPLDSALVLQLLYGVVVAEMVRVDAGAVSSCS